MSKTISSKNSIITLKYIQSSKENQYFDRKSARKEIKEIAKHIIAFANANGGFLVIGIEDISWSSCSYLYRMCIPIN